MLASLLFVPLSLAPNGGELTFPDGPADPGTIHVRVVDRNRVPLSGVSVRGVFEAADAASQMPGFERRAGHVVLGPVLTGADGAASLRVPDGGWCGLVVERSGFAPGSFLPLFAGYSYELVLDFGAVLRLVVEDEQGVRRPAELSLSFEHFPQLPSGLRCERRLFSGEQGVVEVPFVPRGPVVVRAVGEEGSCGLLRLSVGSAWRYNALAFEGPGRVVLHPTHEHFVPVTDDEGAPVEDLWARLIGEESPGASVSVEPNGVRVLGVPASLDQDLVKEQSAQIEQLLERTSASLPGVGVEVWAPGYRSVRIDCTGDAPPSAYTFRFSTRSVSLPPPPAAGDLWRPIDPYASSTWVSERVAPGEPVEVDVAEGVSIVAALVDSARTVAWIEADAHDPTAARWMRPATIVARLAIDGEPVRCGLVKLELLATETPLPANLERRGLFTFADPGGVCETSGLVPGRWAVSLSTHLVHSEGASAVVDLVEGERREVEIRATRGRSVPGRVVTAGGEALSGGHVQLLGVDATVVEGTYPVREDGTFVASGLLEGFAYVLRWSEAPWSGLFGALYTARQGRPARTAELRIEGGLPDELVLVVPDETDH